MEPGHLKPLLASLALPPASLLILMLVGLVLAARRKRAGLALATLALFTLGLLSCHGLAAWLAQTALPQFAPASAATLQARQVQAIVVLGGGVLPEAPEYGAAQPRSTTAARLRYGVWLARASGLPLAFTGGMGWSPGAGQQASEAEVAARVLKQDYNLTPRWLEGESRDTAENARLLAPLLLKDQVRRIALVTDAWHMPRAVKAFEAAGLTVTPAPTGFVLSDRSTIMEWVPTASSLLASQQVLRELLALAVGRVLSP
jgi:uncharacterized SAM-binding protein YcdF (DUF218 family)